ncbi:MAG: type II toxin-antitoxin system RelE/ParE family toxin [Legionellales bacterium]|nr:type II toxin-antitoxin system RelE/ParE family toxin [Legionellales bacterium]
MANVQIKQMPAFKKAYKKLHLNVKVVVDEEIKKIIKEPTIGEEKKGELKCVFVHKFKVNLQEFLLAYEWDEASRLLMALGVHENFYRDLKRRV